MARPSNAAARDIESLVHPFTNLAQHRSQGPLVMERAKGVYVFDDKGNQYIDGLSGLWCMALGFGNEELVEAAANQMRKLPFASMFSGKSHEPAIELAEKLREISSRPTSKVLFSSGGSDANDMQVKLTWYYNNARGLPNKKKIISRLRSYHGITVASGSLTGLPHAHKDFDLPIGNIIYTECPDYFHYATKGETEEEFSTRLATELRNLIEKEGPDTVAAFIAEPIMGAGGVVMPPKSYFAKVNHVLAQFDVRFIADEVICGFGRTGKWFGSEAFGMNSTSLTMAKAITAGYFPLGAITIEQSVYDAMLAQSEKIGVFGHGYTYTGHPVGCAIGLKAIEIYERDKMLARVNRLAPVFADRILQLTKNRFVGNGRSTGLIGAIEFLADKDAKRKFSQKASVGAYCSAQCQELGFITRFIGDTGALCPPLVISEPELHEMFDRLDAAIKRTEAWIEKSGLQSAE
jgi:4-aminobutyrate--pyruvate transaminase